MSRAMQRIEHFETFEAPLRLMRTMIKIQLTLLMLLLPAAAFAQDAAEAPKTSGPITMHIAGAHPNDVFTELTKQTGVVIQTWPDNIWEQYKHNNPPPPTSISV